MVFILFMFLFCSINLRCFFFISCWFIMVKCLLNNGDLNFCLKGFVCLSIWVNDKLSLFFESVLLLSKIWWFFSLFMCNCEILIKVCWNVLRFFKGKLSLVVIVWLLNLFIIWGYLVLILLSMLWMWMLGMECVEFLIMLLFWCVNVIIGFRYFFFSCFVIILIIFWWKLVWYIISVVGILFLLILSFLSICLVCIFMFVFIFWCFWLSVFNFVVIICVCIVFFFIKYVMFCDILFNLFVVFNFGLIIKFKFVDVRCVLLWFVILIKVWISGLYWLVLICCKFWWMRMWLCLLRGIIFVIVFIVMMFSSEVKLGVGRCWLLN